MKIVLDMVVNHAGYGADERFDPTWFNVEGSGDIKGELAGRSSALWSGKIRQLMDSV